MLTNSIPGVMQPRIHAARQVKRFDEEDVRLRLIEGRETASLSVIAGHTVAPTSHTSFDVCRDEQYLTVSVLACQGGTFGLPEPDGGELGGAGHNVVELLIAPWNDGIGFLQLGAGSGSEQWHRVYVGQ